MKSLCWIRVLFAVCCVSLLLHAPPADAADAEDYTRSGPYVIMGGTYAIENFHNVSSGAVDDSPGFIVHLGWRIHPHASLEAGFEWSSGFDCRDTCAILENTDRGAEFDTYSPTLGFKIHALRGRFQPFLHPSVGLVVARGSRTGSTSDTKASPGMRAGVGFDFYLNKNAFLYAGAYYVLPFKNSIDEIQYIPIAGGIGWRF